MKRLFFLFCLGIAVLSCNSPEQNSATGNTEDSLTVNKSAGGQAGTGAGTQNMADTSKGKTDTVDQMSRKR